MVADGAPHDGKSSPGRPRRGGDIRSGNFARYLCERLRRGSLPEEFRGRLALQKLFELKALAAAISKVRT